MLKKKIAQMLLLGFKGRELQLENPIANAIAKHHIGGVILFEENMHSPAQLCRLTQQLQDYAKQAALIPLFIGTDYEGGTVIRLTEEAGFPKTLSAEEIGYLPDEQINEHAFHMAMTLKQVGINMNFAPCVDINRNPNSVIIGKRKRSFSSDYQVVTHCAAIFSKIYREHGIISVFKHFPGHGSATDDTHAGFVDITETWEKEELEPYKQVLQQSNNKSMVMIAHVVHRGLDDKAYPASLSFAITTGLLRNTLHFEGVVITDDLQMRAIRDHYGLAQAVKLAVNAGADILIFGNQLANFQDPAEIIEIIHSEVAAGNILESRIDKSYQRIMKLKNKLSLTS